MTKQQYSCKSIQQNSIMTKQQHSCAWQNSITPVQVHSKTATWQNSNTLVHDKTAANPHMTKQQYSCTQQQHRDKTAALTSQSSCSTPVHNNSTMTKQQHSHHKAVAVLLYTTTAPWQNSNTPVHNNSTVTKQQHSHHKAVVVLPYRTKAATFLNKTKWLHYFVWQNNCTLSCNSSAAPLYVTKTAALLYVTKTVDFSIWRTVIIVKLSNCFTEFCVVCVCLQYKCMSVCKHILLGWQTHNIWPQDKQYKLNKRCQVSFFFVFWVKYHLICMVQHTMIMIMEICMAC